MIPREVIENTIVDYPRLERLLLYLQLTKDLPGENAEVGVYKGGTAYLISNASHKKLSLFDTFEGMPAVSTMDLHKRGDFSNTSSLHVTKLLKPFPQSYVFKGIFPDETGNKIGINTKFSFVHLDCDIYMSVKNSLEFFYPKMVHGGIIALDDYAEPNCPGAKLATDEFLRLTGEKIAWVCQSQAAFVVHKLL